MLRILADGQVVADYTIEDLLAMPSIQSVEVLKPGKVGLAIKFSEFERLHPDLTNFSYLTLIASRDDFSASLPRVALADEGYLWVYGDGRALSVDEGGPIRFLIPNPAACQTDAVDECVNVKFLDTIEFSHQPGTDTRPRSEEEHDALHANED